MKTLIIASHNVDKLAEIQRFVAAFGFIVKSAGECGVPEPEETGTTFAENAILKAKNCVQHTGELSLADDSGLEVEALNGAPGVYSARWGGRDKNFNQAMEKVRLGIIEKGLEPEGQKARFVCCLALASKNGVETFEGEVRGILTFPPRGLNGFGYDPIFIPDGYKNTFAEVDESVKYAVSHRARAMNLLHEFLSLDLNKSLMKSRL